MMMTAGVRLLRQHDGGLGDGSEGGCFSEPTGFSILHDHLSNWWPGGQTRPAAASSEGLTECRHSVYQDSDSLFVLTKGSGRTRPQDIHHILTCGSTESTSGPILARLIQHRYRCFKKKQKYQQVFKCGTWIRSEPKHSDRIRTKTS